MISLSDGIEAKMMKVEAIVSDVGGVIVRDDFKSFFAQFESKIGMSAEDFYALTVGSEEWKLYNKDFIAEEELWGRLAPKLRVEGEVARELRQWRTMLIPIPETIRILQRVRRRYPLYCLSNVDKTTTRYLQERYRIYDIFDGAILSWEARMRKPEMGVYELVIRCFNLTPERVLYIDDKERNLIPAREVGFQTILYQSPEDFEVKLLNHGVEIWGSERSGKRQEKKGV
ncbi:MAG: HAD family hydrolase [Thermodesulfobacteriota bacterium]